MTNLDPTTTNAITHQPLKKPDFSVSNDRLARDPKVRDWLKRLKDDPDAKPVGLSPAQVTYVIGRSLDRPQTDEYERALRDVTQRIRPRWAAPKVHESQQALQTIFGLPEMQRFWADWTVDAVGSEGSGRRGPKPNIAGAKATMCVLGMTGISSYVQDAVNVLSRDHSLLETFETLERLAQGRANPTLPGLGAPATRLAPPAAKTVYRQLPQLSASCIHAARTARVALMRSLRDQIPEVGRWGLVDGTDLPAWCRQRGARNGDQRNENRLRRYTPHAGFRAYSRDGDGHKIGLNEDGNLVGSVQRAVIKSWRGYYIVVIIDVASGNLPLAIEVFDASKNEAWGVPRVLEQLHELWPEVQMHSLAGDSGFDIDWVCELLMRSYSINPVFRLHNERDETRQLNEKQTRGNVQAISPNGQLICAKHGESCEHLGVEGLRREDRGTKLAAGEELGERTIRVRARCRQCDQRVSLPAELDWSLLCHHPHHTNATPRLAAERHVHLANLNGVESFFNRLKSGYKISTEGPDRTRVRDITTVTALVELAALTMVAQTVYDVRREHGIPLQNVLPDAATEAQAFQTRMAA